MAADLLVDCAGQSGMLDLYHALEPGRTRIDENPLYRQIHCPKVYGSVARLALEGAPDRIMSVECLLSLLDVVVLAARIDRARQVARATIRRGPAHPMFAWTSASTDLECGVSDAERGDVDSIAPGNSGCFPQRALRTRLPSDLRHSKAGSFSVLAAKQTRGHEANDIGASCSNRPKVPASRSDPILLPCSGGEPDC